MLALLTTFGKVPAPPAFPHTPFALRGDPKGPRPHKPAISMREFAGIAGTAGVDWLLWSDPFGGECSCRPASRLSPCAGLTLCQDGLISFPKREPDHWPTSDQRRTFL